MTPLIILMSFDVLTAILFWTMGKMTTEQRSAIKVCVLNGSSRKDTIHMLEKAYGIRAMKKSQVYEWYGRFENGQVSINDESRSGRSASITSRHVTSQKSENCLSLSWLQHSHCSRHFTQKIWNEAGFVLDGFRKCCLRTRRSTELSVVGDKWNVLSEKMINWIS